MLCKLKALDILFESQRCKDSEDGGDEAFEEKLEAMTTFLLTEAGLTLIF